MQAKDVMTHPVISVSSRSSILEAVRLMLQHKISGLPVLDESGSLAGIVSEGDLLRRVETDTLRRRPRWIEFLVGPGKLADEYVHASTRKISEVMTSEVHTVSENAPLDDVITTMEQNHIKRVPVMYREKLVGIVTRTNLLRR
jgi:CBS domain-containing protein